MKEHLDVDIEGLTIIEPYLFFTIIFISLYILCIRLINLDYPLYIGQLAFNLWYGFIIIITGMLTTFRHDIYDKILEYKQKWTL